jgi:hypothetical protein
MINRPSRFYMEIHMRLSDACPAGTASCNDVTAINLLLLLFPVAVVLAFLSPGL